MRHRNRRKVRYILASISVSTYTSNSLFYSHLSLFLSQLVIVLSGTQMVHEHNLEILINNERFFTV